MQKERLEYHTSLHIGGEADYLVTPSTVDEIKEVTMLCKMNAIPYYIIGNGSNLLASDQGYRGVIIKLGERFSQVTIEDGRVTAQAGVLLSKLANMVAKNGLTGFEFAAGIPGTLGGAVTMNAGAYDGEIKQCIISVKVMDRQGDVFELDKEELELEYRSSILQKKNYILLEAVLQFDQGDMISIMERINELNNLRKEKQPLEQYSAGSTFKRPQGYYAGKLINDAGLRGYQVGQAAVSEKHCGFIINKGSATAKEFLTVIQDVRRTVYEKFGVKLEPEVKFLGEFDEELIEAEII
ncbi:UDP-N-acetylmuramate dehydrogenase [Mobilitalea sibirica]|uniref:UDP-N-acetylenolpyruvoylglucosamine reductase n=2 Tax=Mobilitalea sibirica TaxID=1462919 RepID=A0A8J7H5F5_9FIRM|nr:UDP-N-acetylmuramate dehydrogenase [Mobilitalea sibirica]